MERDGHRYSPAKFYKINIIILIILIILGTAVFLIFACNVNNVTVRGNTLLGASEIEGYVMADKYRNNGAWDVVKNTLRPPEIPFVKETKVSLHNLHDLVITVKEKELTGRLKDKNGNYVYIDRNGIVTEVDPRLLGKAVPVEGLTTKKSAVVGKAYPAAENRVKALSVIFKSMKNMGLDISKVTFGDSGQITLTCGKVTASFGTADRLKDKLLRLSYILPKVKGSAGILHFEDFTEDNTDIVFEKKKTK
ncbi:MAG: hypothetical protein DUD27_05540 [Lachnospiraceae bacterium]|uniref:Cell division protein FtsQ/DivIB C-terminal domain-containing protein n=1 Tax=Candidatus Weimeria bifida TaxID=2599074 RepID=A0A6N7IWZ4_9FIRM|nr:hypothetical protein [Candidatus Weimeria bifida]RRF96254.1 MAG: hypothetical protein DUD27_05540 [Lachnospiraceae bacterium]